MTDNNDRDEILDVMEDFDILDTIEQNGDTYFVMTPIESYGDGEVFIMKLVEVDGAEMLEAVDDDAEYDPIYEIFKQNNSDEFDFLD